MHMKKLIILLILGISIIPIFGSLALAQIRETDVVLIISPDSPSPNQNVNALVSSYSINLDRANISWSIDNQELSNGIGKKSFSFNVGESGSPTILSLVIETVDGQNILKTMTITPAGVDLLWEAYGVYTPPFYRGKTLVPSQGEFKVVAMPNLINLSGKVNPKNLSYTWKKDSVVRSNFSGWGKNYIIVQNSYLDKINTAEVQISDISGGMNAKEKITLRTIKPKIVFYESDPSLGIRWENTLSDNFVIDPNGKTVVAEPYFFSPRSINSSELTFKWFLGGKKIETPYPKNVLSIKPEEGQPGNSTIKAVVENINTLFQITEKQISVNF